MFNKVNQEAQPEPGLSAREQTYNRRPGDMELAKRAMSSVLGYAFLFAIFFSLTPFYTDHPEITSATIVMVVFLVVARITVAKKMLKDYDNNPKLYIRLFYFFAILSAAAYGIFSYITFYFYKLEWTAMLVLAMTCGIASGGTNSLATDTRLSRIFLLLVLMPLILWGGIEQTLPSVAISIITFVYLAMLLSINKKSFEWYWQSIKNSALLNERTNQLKDVFQKITNDAQFLNESSINLSGLSDDMKQRSIKMSQNIKRVTSSSQEVNSNIHLFSEAVKKNTGNFDMISSSIEQLTSSIRDIFEKTGKALGTTKGAVEQTQQASDKVDRLGAVANEISNITEVISDISDQINLLALNATIEAARAGDAGKGFAVVANEVKELAKQTAEATLKIREQIEEIQTSSLETVDQIKQIMGVTENVNEIVSIIATSVEEQSNTTTDIATTLCSVNKEIYEMDQRIQAAITSTENIANEISVIDQSFEKMDQSSSSVQKSAQNTLALANRLRENAAIKIDDDDTIFEG